MADAYQAWVAEAAEIVVSRLGADELQRLRTQAGEQLATIRAEVDALREAMRLDVSALELELPEPVVPAAQLNGHRPPPLVDSAWSFADQCRRLLASKEYRP